MKMFALKNIDDNNYFCNIDMLDDRIHVQNSDLKNSAFYHNLTIASYTLAIFSKVLVPKFIIVEVKINDNGEVEEI